MSSFSRVELKEIIKECVVEVLQESFSALQLVNEVQTRSTPKTRKVAKNRKAKRTPVINEGYEEIDISNEQYASRKQRKISHERSSQHLDKISYQRKSRDQDNRTEEFENKVNSVTNKMTSDPILADILKDTALTTLQEQMQAESRRGSMPIATNGDAAARTVSQSDPADLFGDAAGKWAQLAFASPTKGTK